MPRAVPGNQGRIIEIVPGIKPDPRGQAGAEIFFMRLIQQRNLDSVHLRRVIGNDPQHQIRGDGDIARTPIARQGRIKHLPKPMQHHRSRRLVQKPPVNPRVHFRSSAHRGEGTAGHQDQLPARRLDRRHLRLIGGDDAGLVPQSVQRDMIRPRPAGDSRLQ